MQEARVTLEHAYWVRDDICSIVDGVPFLVDTGAEVSMTRRCLKTAGSLRVQLVDGTVKSIPFRSWKGIVWLLGDYDLIPTRDLKTLHQDSGNRVSPEEESGKILC